MKLACRSYCILSLLVAVIAGVTASLVSWNRAFATDASMASAEGFFPKAKLSQPVHQIKVTRDVMIPMRDGVRLAADIYIPTAKGKFPALVLRTPYNKTGDRADAEYFASRGYAVVLQDTRGRYASEGDFYFVLDDGWGEHKDGYDTVEWIADQPWCNGNVGSFGLSYTAMDQYMMAPTRPPHLKAMFAGMAFSDYYKHMRYPNGALRGTALSWMVERSESARHITTMEDWQAWLRLQNGSAVSFYRSFLAQDMLDWLDHPTRDAYWDQAAVYKRWQEIDVPIYHHDGWYDRFTEAITQNFNGVLKNGMSEKTRKSQKLIIGPWPHTAQGPRVIGDIDFGPAAEVDLNAVRLRWFDYWLKGIDNGIMNESPISIFVMGRNTWRYENEWPLARTQNTPYYFHGGSGNPSFSLNDGVLSSAKADDKKPDQFVADPLNPLPTIGGDDFGSGQTGQGPKDQRPVEAKSLTYTTEPLTQDIEVTGPVTVVLYASSSAVDTDFVAMICDVHPDGYSQILRNNALRASYRESLEKRVPLKPGEMYQLTFQLNPISNVFKAGHRIRVSISGSSFPKYVPNTNSWKQFGDDTEILKATNVVYHDAAHPSHVVLPIIPATGN